MQTIEQIRPEMINLLYDVSLRMPTHFAGGGASSFYVKEMGTLYIFAISTFCQSQIVPVQTATQKVN